MMDKLRRTFENITMRTSRNISTLTRLGSFSLLVSILASVTISQPSSAQSGKSAARRDARLATSGVKKRETLKALPRFATNLTTLASEGRFTATDTHDEAVQRILRILSRPAHSPVLLDEIGEARNAVVEAVALKLAAGEVPSGLRRETQLWRLDLSTLLAAASDEAGVVNHLNAMLAEVKRAKGQHILYVDEITSLLGANPAHGSRVAETLRVALKEGSLRLIGATTAANYEADVAPDAELSVYLRKVTAGELSSDEQAENEESSEDKRYEFVGEKVSPDLRELAQSGAPGERVPVILQADDINNAESRALLRRNGVRINEAMAGVGAMKVELPLRAVTQIEASGKAQHLSLDRNVNFLGHIETTTGAAAVRSSGTFSGSTSSTLDGSGIGIAVLDSSIFNSHHSFLGTDGNKRIVVNVDFTGEGMNTDDPYGHGTHVASLAAGSGGQSGDGISQYKGAAPNAKLINLHVLDSKGVGKSSGLLSALNWLLTNRTQYNIRVVNLSLGAPAIETYKNDPLCRAVRKLVDAGVVVVAAAGNNGKNSAGQKLYGLIHSPGNEPSAITVGATNTFGTNARSDDGIATYSSRGPTRSYWKDTAEVKHYDNLIKPDLVAPGNKLIGAEAENNYLVENNPQLDARDPSENDDTALMYMSGTSMATPIVAGAAALLQANPKLTPNMIKMLLMYTAQPLKGFNTLEQGAGQLNIEGAVRLAKLVRTDQTWATTAQGTLLLKLSTLPDFKTTLAGHTFTWAQGILLNHRYATGINLITKYHTIYGLGIVMGDGIVFLDGDNLWGDGIVMGEGIVMGDAFTQAMSALVGGDDTTSMPDDGSGDDTPPIE